MSTSYIQALSQKAGVYQRTMQGILSKAELEGRALTPDEQRDFSNLETKAKAALDSVTAARSNALSVPDGTIIGNPVDRRASEPWGQRHEDAAGFGKFLAAVRSAYVNPGSTDPRLLEQRASGMSGGVGGDGGFAIPAQFSDTLLRRVWQSPLASRCQTIEITQGSGIELPYIEESSRVRGSRLGGVRAYWLGEGAPITPSQPKLGRLALKLKKLSALCYATDELLEDASAMGRVILDGFAEELAFEIDDAIFRGTGAGMPQGVMFSPALVTVAKESAQSSAGVVLANVRKMWARMPGRLRSGAVWVVSSETESELYEMSLTVGTGGSAVFLPGGGASATPFSTLFGRPMIVHESASQLGTVGDIALLNLSEYILARKGGVQAASSIHIKFDTGETAFRAITRVDGASAWAEAVTPASGNANAKQSPFITLAARP